MKQSSFSVSVVAISFLSSTTALYATTVNPLAAADAPAAMQSALGAPDGITITSIDYIGGDNQAATYTGFDLASTDPSEPTLTLGDGFLMTTGNAAIATSNTEPGFTGITDTGSNAAIEATLEAAGTPAVSTNDQNVFSFEFTAEAGINALNFDFVFGSDEYPEFPSFIDSFMFFVDGINYAFFPNGDLVAQSAGTAGFFNDNTDLSYGIEYDGLTNVLSLTGLLDTSLSTHTATFAIADANDSILDSGVFVSGLGGTTTDGGGGITPGGGGGMSAVPLPAAGWLLIAGLGGLGLIRRK